jgi:bifunctional non-homologous end joining protein LigD
VGKGSLKRDLQDANVEIRSSRFDLAVNTKLSSYRAKRDFTRTSEPSGDNPVAPSEIRRFVIQKHAASRLHYDFRLELDGVLKSWAVTKGPSLNPREKRLAVEVEDHPLDYGDFEGTIPKGQYGGGTVQLWDRGYWLPEDADPAGAIRKGELKFAIAGARLHGTFVLVRLKSRRPGEKRNNWLLIKHRDEFARDDGAGDLLAEDRSVASGRAMADIAAGRPPGPMPFILSGAKQTAPDAIWNSDRGSAAELRAAMAAGHAPQQHTANSAEPLAKVDDHPKQVMPLFISPELCKVLDRPPSGTGWVHEIKLDGYRIQTRVENGSAVLRTRRNLNWTDKFDQVSRAAERLPDGIYDGEIVALNDTGIPDFGALQAALAEGQTGKLIYFVFDLLFSLGRDLQNLQLHERKTALRKIIEQLPPDSMIRYVEHFEAPGESMLESARNMSLEGIVSKRADDIYRPGQREWAKIKLRPTQEVVLGGWTSEGERFRSLLAGIYRDNQFVYIGRIGTGFSEDVVSHILPRLKRFTVDKSPFEGRSAPRSRSGINWLKPEIVAEIEFAGWTTDGNIRAAAFKRLREDKAATEISAAYIAPANQTDAVPAIAAQAGSNGLSSNPKTGATVTVLGVDISHPDKVMWPDAGDGRPVTKRELARYYEEVGEWVIGYIKGRPCSIVRAPDGIGGEHFFQRHAMNGMSPLLKTTKVPGDHEPYLQIDSVKALIAVAQVAALELHPWNCKPYEPEIPGRLVFDLDPALDVDFSAVVEAARELNDRLSVLGLLSFCKTTGGKGLHVVTPISQPAQQPIEWPVAKKFAEAVVTQMAADSPSRYLTTMAKKDRRGRIYLDYLRNDRISTAVALLSTRARQGATVSMPLDWTQVTAGLDPMRFTIRTAPHLIATTKPWKHYADSERSLEDAIRRLTRTGA